MIRVPAAKQGIVPITSRLVVVLVAFSVPSATLIVSPELTVWPNVAAAGVNPTACNAACTCANAPLTRNSPSAPTVPPPPALSTPLAGLDKFTVTGSTGVAWVSVIVTLASGSRVVSVAAS